MKLLSITEEKMIMQQKKEKKKQQVAEMVAKNEEEINKVMQELKKKYECQQPPTPRGLLNTQVTYVPSQFKNNEEGGFMILDNYMGALSNPQIKRPEKIAMTATVITKTTPENTHAKTVTMQFVLPGKYKRVEEAPEPVDERVVTREVGDTKYGVVTFGGVATAEEEKVDKLEEWLERDWV